MKKNYILIGAVAIIIIVLVVVLATRKTTVKTNNANITVSQGTNTVTVNTNAGSFQAGQKVSLPSDFPSDVYLTEGTLQSALKIDQDNSFTVNLQSDKTVAEVKAEYEEQLPADGWTITSTTELPVGTSVVADKGNRNTSVIISDSSGTTTVSVTTSAATD